MCERERYRLREPSFERRASERERARERERERARATTRKRERKRDGESERPKERDTRPTFINLSSNPITATAIC
jgi:septal ring factor EnvC (AmiA/AmiB activator)